MEITLQGGDQIMRIKKLLACGAVGILLAGLFVAPVSAHGHHRQAEDTDKICSLCTVEDCTETGYHIHDNQTYCGYDHACGYCDGSCVKQSESKSSNRGSHHGGRHNKCHH